MTNMVVNLFSVGGVFALLYLATKNKQKVSVVVGSVWPRIPRPHYVRINTLHRKVWV